MRSIFFTFLFFSVMTVTNAIPPTLSIRANEVYSGNAPFVINGINWFGFNNAQTMVDGLWVGGTSFATDFNTIVYKLKLLGFNSVRLPFTHYDISLKSQPKTRTCEIYSSKRVIGKTIDPAKAGSKSKPPPFYSVFPKSICNEYLVNGTTLDRLIQTMDTFLYNNMYVILDYHPMNTEFQAKSVDAFSRSWGSLWYNILKRRPWYQGKVILDIMNEPDSMDIGWTRAKSKGPSITDLTFAMIDRIQRFDNTVLYMIEGTGQVKYNLNWGDGFVTDKNVIKQYDLDDPNPFFQKLVSQTRYQNKIIISPHMYGPTVSKNRIAHKGKIFRDRVYNSFGYLYQKGYCYQNICTKFPIVIGEFGSTFKDPEDIQHLNELADIINKSFGRRTGWMFWAYNANSGDTGGIVTDDWQELNWTKLRWLRDKIGLKIW